MAGYFLQKPSAYQKRYVLVISLRDESDEEQLGNLVELDLTNKVYSPTGTCALH
jgi:hypothetical protein